MKVAIPTVEDVQLEDDDGEWYLRGATMVFPTVEATVAAKRTIVTAGSVTVHPIMLRPTGVDKCGPQHMFKAEQ